MSNPSIYRASIGRLGWSAALLAALVTVGGCASGDEAGVEQGSAASGATSSRGESGKTVKYEAMVRAVSAGKPGAPVEVKFDLATRPVVGEPLELTVAMSAMSDDVATLEVVFNVSEGLQIVGGASSPRVAKPKPGQPILHTVRLLPTRDGVFYVSAVALVDTVADGSSVARTFSIPVIVGEGGGAEAAKPSATVLGSGGERISPLPAQESR